MKTALTIAGSDSSGGAGIQADLKAMTMNGVFAMSAITALTAQNTTGVSGIFEVSPEFLAQQIDAVFTDMRNMEIFGNELVRGDLNGLFDTFTAEHFPSLQSLDMSCRSPRVL